jgi:hypothetical protein
VGRAAAGRVGGAALVFSALYLLSDVIEVVQGGFTAGQLWLTLVAEAAISMFVLGLYAVQRPHIAPFGWWSAAAYTAVYVYFTTTVAYALAAGTPDFDALSVALSPWMTVGGAVMVLAGTGFGVATIRAGVALLWPRPVRRVGGQRRAASDPRPVDPSEAPVG